MRFDILQSLRPQFRELKAQNTLTNRDQRIFGLCLSFPIHRFTYTAKSPQRALCTLEALLKGSMNLVSPHCSIHRHQAQVGADRLSCQGICLLILPQMKASSKMLMVFRQTEVGVNGALKEAKVSA